MTDAWPEGLLIGNTRYWNLFKILSVARVAGLCIQKREEGQRVRKAGAEGEEPGRPSAATAGSHLAPETVHIKGAGGEEVTAGHGGTSPGQEGECREGGRRCALPSEAGHGG